MHKSFVALATIAPLALLATSHVASAQARSLVDEIADRQALARVAQLPFADVCSAAQPGHARCLSKAVTDEQGQVRRFDTPKGYGPPDIASAYKLPASGGNGKLVAVVDANDSANAESDLATYRSQYGLPPCTTQNGCFEKVDQNGGTHYPTSDGCSNGWAAEISLDLDMVSAACPDCRILLVEASSTDDSDLAAAVATALKMGAVAVSNSYGGSEDSSAAQLDAVYSSTTAWVTASAGDSGYGASFPATGSHVLAVGGTTLQQSSSSRGWAEGAWSKSGSGCSGVISKPGWQTDGSCTHRMEADVSAVADPNTGVAVYCTDGGGLGGFPGGGFPGWPDAGFPPFPASGGWMVFGGTSASSPIVAGAFTLLGVPPDPSMPWKTSGKAFFDVTSGSNGSCATEYFCNAGVGYDGPTGWGTPNGALLLTLGGEGGSSGGGDAGSDAGKPGADGGDAGGGGSGDGDGTGDGTGDGVDAGGLGSGVDAGSAGNSATSGGPTVSPGSGCSCAAVDGERQGGGGLAVGLGLVIGWGIRRRTARRRRAG